MRRKRRTKYEWFLPAGTIGPAADTDDTTVGRAFQVIAAANATSVTTIVDLLNDTASEDTTLAQATVFPMGVTAANDYFIKRIVGKLYANITRGSTGADALLLGVGLFIARAGDFRDAAGAENFPLGASAAGAVRNDNYSVLDVENSRQPWIWRRTWILGNHGIAAPNANNQNPENTQEFGSVADGPHVDAKTARRVRNGERLFLAATARNFPLNVTSTAATAIDGYFDYRVLGAMRRTHNRSTF